MRTKLIVVALMLMAFVGHAQQDAQYSQYMYNTDNVNPAYVGSRGVLSAFGLFRTQWVGIEGAPQTANLAISTPINRTNLGIGLSFVSDKLGATDENTIAADVSYTIKTSEKYKLAFGLKVTADLFNLDKTKLSPSDLSDPNLQNINSFSPNMGAGLYFYSDVTYFGLSVPNFLETTKYNDEFKTPVYKDRMNVYLIGGHVFNLNDDLKFKPAFLLKEVKGAPLQLDLSANFLINETFTLGAAWRWSAAASFLAGFQATKGLYIGYGYDLETTRLRKYNSGSHEIFLRFDLFKHTDKIISPRFF